MILGGCDAFNGYGLADLGSFSAAKIGHQATCPETTPCEPISWTQNGPTDVVACWTQSNPDELAGANQANNSENYLSSVARSLSSNGRDALLADFFDVSYDSRGDVIFVDVENSADASFLFPANDDPLSLMTEETN